MLMETSCLLQFILQVSDLVIMNEIFYSSVVETYPSLPSSSLPSSLPLSLSPGLFNADQDHFYFNDALLDAYNVTQNVTTSNGNLNREIVLTGEATPGQYEQVSSV